MACYTLGMTEYVCRSAILDTPMHVGAAKHELKSDRIVKKSSVKTYQDERGILILWEEEPGHKRCPAEYEPHCWK